MTSPMFQAFWLVCGLWCGIGGGLYTWFSMRKHVARGKFSQQEVLGFAKGMALWIFVPCLMLWGMQVSIPGDSSPLYFKWPAPQRYMALALQVLVWGALVYWVFFRSGATILSKFRSATSKAPAFMNSPAAMKFGVVAAVAVSLLALLHQDF